MIDDIERIVRGSIVRYIGPPSKESASDWACKNIVIPATESRGGGRASLHGREYMRDLIDWFRKPDISDLAACFGSQVGKTMGVMFGLASAVIGCTSVLWVMPNREMVRKHSKNRWMPLIAGSDGTAHLIPSGKDQHSWTVFDQRIGASIVQFVGSHSAASLSSTPVGLVILDEVDKLARSTKRDGNVIEADAVNLAEQRTKDFPNPKRIKTSTPTVPDGAIWQEFLKGDQRRYNVPCPNCEKKIVLAWSKMMTVLPLIGNESFVTWDSEAKRKDGIWDLGRVVNSARVECCFCGFHILDAHKTRMVRDGIWMPTNPHASTSFWSMHLPSMYAASPETNFGRLAEKFLTAKRSLMGPQGFINGELAEPFQNQHMATSRVEIISAAEAAPLADKVVVGLSADFQWVRPHWWVARMFAKNGDSRLVEFGPWETWEQLREIQIRLGVQDQDVVVDSAWGTQEVYSSCSKFGKHRIVRDAKTGLAKMIWHGWTPCKGRDENAIFTGPKGERRLFDVRVAPTGKASLPLLEFNGPHIKDVLERLRKKQTAIRWEVNEKADAEYWRHMDSEVSRNVYDSRTRRMVRRWEPRSKDWPNHLRDCEIQHLARAMRDGVLNLLEEKKK